MDGNNMNNFNPNPNPGYGAPMNGAPMNGGYGAPMNGAPMNGAPMGAPMNNGYAAPNMNGMQPGYAPMPAQKKPLPFEIFCMRNVIRVLALIVFLFTCLPAFLITCTSDRSIKQTVTVFTAIGGKESSGFSVGAMPWMVLLLLIPFGIIGITFIKEAKKAALFSVIAAGVDTLLWITFLIINLAVVASWNKDLGGKYFKVSVLPCWVFCLIFLLLLIGTIIIVMIHAFGFDMDSDFRPTFVKLFGGGNKPPRQQPMYQQPMGQPMYQQPMGQPMMQQPMGQPMQQPMGQPMPQPMAQPVQPAQPMPQPMAQPQPMMQQPAQPAAGFGFCPVCGKPLTDNGKFCASCGAIIPGK